MQTGWILGAAVAAATGLAGVTGVAQAGGIVPLEQSRTVDGFLIVPLCQADTFDSESAPGFDAFDASVDVFAGCDFSQADAIASQQSEVGPGGGSATGHAASSALAAMPSVIHAISGSVYDVTFDLPEAGELSLSGTLTASKADTSTFAFAGALVTLFGPAGETLFERFVEPGEDGQEYTETFAETLALDAGAYRIRASAGSIIDNQLPPDLWGEASFDLSFGVGGGCPADVDGDGTVGVEDAVAVILAWGDADPAADVDGSGVVDVADLVEVILAWGDCD